MKVQTEEGLSHIAATGLIVVLVLGLTLFGSVAFLGYTNKMPSGNILPFSRVVPADALAYYGFDDAGSSTITKDLSPYDNDARLSGAQLLNSPLWREYKNPSDKWGFVSGQNSFFWVPASPSLNATGNLTVEAWVKWNVVPTAVTTANRQSVVLEKGYGDSVFQYRIAHSNNYGTGQSPYFTFAVRPGTTVRTVNSLTQPQKGVWYYVVGTWNSRNTATTGRLAIYVNGKLERSATYSTANLYTSPYRLTLGGQYTNAAMTTTGRFFNGDIDEVGITGRAMSADEIKSRYNRYVY
ncbi:LamG domain-containing protein [uncultured Methanoregula sp.]|uniref:LamG domain-containing protein n=1 Tax=uncultured Methanoregula sp. TaxID=1005933 RepID=UPI002AAB4B54|nr:LamG domain-containing protein [uncultured Methanoregula sp.]